MRTEVPSTDPSSRPLKVRVIPADPSQFVPNADPNSAAIRVPIAKVPITEWLESRDLPRSMSTPGTSAQSGTPPALANSIDSLVGQLRLLPASALRADLTGLPQEPEVLQRMVIELLRALRGKDRDLEETRRRLDALLRPAPKPSPPDQPTLFDAVPEPLEPTPLPPPLVEEKPARRRGSCKPHGRRRPAPELRREIRHHELTEAERGCPGCGQQRRSIGIETTQQYDYKPAEVFVIEHQQVKYACPCCAGHVTLAPKPLPPIEKGLPGPSLLAQIVTDKYLDHLPLHRSEQRFRRLGVHLPRSTMCDWMAAAASQLQGLWDLLKKHVLQSKVLHTDDTTVPVRDERLSQHRYGRLWDYIGDADHPGVVFDYTITHARDGPATFLKDFRGFLQADAYSVYDGIYTGSKGTIIEVGCWAHARNKFKNAETSDPERVLAAKAYVRRLYDIEDEAKAQKLSAVERSRLRQEKSIPVLKSFHHWLETQRSRVLPKSPIAGAINYVLNQWQALMRYTTDGDLDIDNNLSERTLKLIGMGRGNWLFVGSDKGGRTAAVLFSFTATCKHLGIDAFAYLRDVFERLSSHPAERLDELLPHRWKALRQPPLPASD